MTFLNAPLAAQFEETDMVCKGKKKGKGRPCNEKPTINAIAETS